MEFREYLLSKNIDALSFEKNNQQLFLGWKKEFELMHASSFTEQKKFQINRIRRNHILVIR